MITYIRTLLLAHTYTPNVAPKIEKRQVYTCTLHRKHTNFRIEQDKKCRFRCASLPFVSFVPDVDSTKKRRKERKKAEHRKQPQQPMAFRLKIEKLSDTHFEGYAFLHWTASCTFSNIWLFLSLSLFLSRSLLRHIRASLTRIYAFCIIQSFFVC